MREKSQFSRIIRRGREPEVCVHRKDSVSTVKKEKEEIQGEGAIVWGIYYGSLVDQYNLAMWSTKQ